MILDLFVVLLGCVGGWFLFTYLRDARRKEARLRHPVSAVCTLCEYRGMPNEHPARLHDASLSHCKDCGFQVDDDCWDAHWRLAHGTRPTAPEDSTEWKR